MFLQRWLNGFNLGEYPDLFFVDSRVGRITITALNCTQGDRYLELTEARKKDRKFLYGCMRHQVSE